MLWPKSNIPVFYRDISEKEWTDWQWQLANTFNTVEDLKNATHKNFPRTQERVRLTPYLFSLINFKNPVDPIGLQHLPHKAENQSSPVTAFAQIWERKKDFLDGENRLLQQKYPDIVALRISNTCHAFCRFCFEKERTLRQGVRTKVGRTEWEQVLKKIRARKSIRQVLLTGGDPLILPDRFLKNYLETMLGIPHLKTIRINTRTLLHNPYRITPEFARMLGDLQRTSWLDSQNDGQHGKSAKSGRKPAISRGKEIKIGLHFNHPREITSEAVTAIRRLQREGIQLYNQTVLLKGINNNTSILHRLFRRLREEGIELHYLSQAMAVPGTEHFHTRVRDGQMFMEKLRKTGEFRQQLPSFEYSHWSGKQIIPTTMHQKFREIFMKKNGEKIRMIRYKSDFTGKWITFTDGK